MNILKSNILLTLTLLVSTTLLAQQAHSAERDVRELFSHILRIRFGFGLVHCLEVPIGRIVTGVTISIF